MHTFLITMLIINCVSVFGLALVIAFHDYPRKIAKGTDVVSLFFSISFLIWIIVLLVKNAGV